VSWCLVASMERSDRGSESGADGLQTLAIALELIEELQTANGATVAELQDRLDLSKSAIYNHLNTLREYGYVVKEGDRFQLSLTFTLIGEFVREQFELFSIAKSEIDEFSSEIGFPAHLITEQHHNRLEVYVTRESDAIGTKSYSVYDPLHFHTTANGKSMLAFMDEDKREAILDKHGLPRQSSNTITDRDELAEELDLIRERGYSVSKGEEMEGLWGVGAPVKGQDGSVAGALSISGPVGQLPEERIHDELGEAVVNTADAIQLDLIMASRTEQ